METYNKNKELIQSVSIAESDYKNDYTKKEDVVLWELHEIRHKLHKDFKNKSLEEINTKALRKYRNWKEQKEKIKFNQSKKIRCITELEGLVSEIWKNIDAQKYVNKERKSWD